MTQERTRSINEGIGNLGSGGGRLGRGDAASDREALNHACEDFAFNGKLQFDAHDSTRGRLSELGAASLDLDARTEGGQLAVQEDRVIQVHGVDQALDDGNALVHRRTQRCVNCRPARANQRIGNTRGQLGRQCTTGHRTVSKAQVFGEGEGIANNAKAFARDNRGHLLDVVAIDGRRSNARSTRKQIISGHGQA